MASAQPKVGFQKKHRTKGNLGCNGPMDEEQDACDSIDGEMRQKLAWQTRMAQALVIYSETVRGAMETLARGHEELIEAGIGEYAEAAPTSLALLQGFREAQAAVKSAADKSDASLRSLRAMMGTCAEDIHHADQAAAECRYYTGKIDGLESAHSELREKLAKVDKAEVPEKAQEKLRRNQEKTKQAKLAASIAESRAMDTYQGCSRRSEHLCEMLLDGVMATSCSVAHAAGLLPHLTGVAAAAATKQSACAAAAVASVPLRCVSAPSTAPGVALDVAAIPEHQPLLSEDNQKRPSVNSFAEDAAVKSSDKEDKDVIDVNNEDKVEHVQSSE